MTLLLASVVSVNPALVNKLQRLPLLTAPTAVPETMAVLAECNSGVGGGVLSQESDIAVDE